MSQTHAQLLDKYAELTVKSGLNLRKGQQLLMTAPLEAVDLVRRITHHAYKAGASLVTTLYNDEQATLMRFTDGDDSAFDAAAGWLFNYYAELIADPYAVATRLHADLAALGVQGLALPDPVAVARWIEPELRRRDRDECDHAALTDAQRALLGAIEDSSVLDLDFANEALVAEAATWRAAG